MPREGPAGAALEKTVPAEPASARAPTTGSVGPFELAPAPDPERLMPLLPSLKKCHAAAAPQPHETQLSPPPECPEGPFLSKTCLVPCCANDYQIVFLVAMCASNPKR